MKKILVIICSFCFAFDAFSAVTGSFVTYNNETYYEIVNPNEMQPFFISVSSDDDLWMYISSTGSLTCGRQNPDKALFPYNTDDVILSTSELTGAKTIIRYKAGGKYRIWEPFSDRQMGQWKIERRIAKSVTGNRLRFTEKNLSWGVTFSYEWCATSEDGWVRTAQLSSDKKKYNFEILDGVQNVVPAGIDRYTNMNMATLVDAYKRTEQVPGSFLVLFTMEATLVDRPMPSESLTANTAYFVGLPSNAQIQTSARQLDAFRKGEQVNAEPLAKGVRGAALSTFKTAINSSSPLIWSLVMNTRQDAVQVHNILALSKSNDVAQTLIDHQNKATAQLHQIVAKNDGVQLTADTATMARHFANTLYNTMRGGYYCDNYNISRDAFRAHVCIFNKDISAQYDAWLATLPETITYEDLAAQIVNQKSSNSQWNNLYRLFLEYLPMTFSRRHGDPSRPWNLFNIRVHDEQGNPIISYQGNWRDIFQNWEALSVSYPDFVNSIIAKFFNATTMDGYNPYRITSEGIDWEVANPADPWSNIGYWGDHQIIYLCKLLELSYDHDPALILSWLNQPIFASANVPYRIKSYDEIVANPKNTIVFDMDMHRAIMAKVPEYGADAKLICSTPLFTFTDKSLITLLTKFSNFIPEAGIWMNTLRPEWNDANNALVGNGASMVTLYYMRRYVSFLQKLYNASNDTNYQVAQPVYDFFASIHAALQNLDSMGSNALTDAQRRQIIDQLGRAGEQYRAAVYSLSSKSDSTRLTTAVLQHSELIKFFATAITVIDRSIAANKRADGLYEAYNLVEFTDNEVRIEHLYEMLEGQVAILSSDALSAEQAVAVLNAMETSKLYREDQQSYILYPFRQLPSFMMKNTFRVADPSRIATALKTGIVLQDADGNYHFGGDVNNAETLTSLMDQSSESFSVNERYALLDLYEQTFHHHAFTGRSGTMYKYEGLGSIYWHMVSKLDLAIAENIVKAESTGNQTAVEALIAHYRKVQAGIGSHKNPKNYGSFPFDAYSHTPSMAGVQQPGLTGQVKEDIISRFIELGIRVVDGEIHIVPTMLRKDEFFNGELRFTYCGTDFVYRLGNTTELQVETADSTVHSLDTNAALTIPATLSRHIFARDGQVKQVLVTLAL